MNPGCHHTPIYASNTHARLEHQEKPATGILVVEGRFGDKVLYLGWYGFRPNPAAQKGVEGYLDTESSGDCGFTYFYLQQPIHRILPTGSVTGQERARALRRWLECVTLGATTLPYMPATLMPGWSIRRNLQQGSWWLKGVLATNHTLAPKSPPPGGWSA